MNQLNLFIELTRLKKPIGYMLLFWPCAWGLTIGYDFSNEKDTYFFYLILFLSGSILMRSAGCIINDIIDRKFDKKVFRTKNRPIASGLLSKKLAWIYTLILCSLAFLILIQFNFLTICLGIFSVIFIFSYPFMKRYTYWPQLFLGFTFNWGIVMAWTSIMDEVSYLAILLYIGAIFWTLGYDTIYGIQDISDDEVIGVKSTAIRFQKNLNLFIGSCYLISSTIILFIMMTLKINYSLIFSIFFVFSLFYQIKICQIKSSQNCLRAFKLNNLSALTVFVGFFLLTFEI